MKRPVLLAIAAALVALAVAFGCATRHEDGAPVDVEIMAFLSEARALHHQANLREDARDLPGAIAAMQRLVAAPRPHDGKAPEVREVLADAYARITELETARGHLDAANEAARQGLVQAPEASYFRGHLFEVQGLAEKARVAELADAGRPAEAEQARERAAQLLEEAVKIQEQVILRSLAAREAGTDRSGK